MGNQKSKTKVIAPVSVPQKQTNSNPKASMTRILAEREYHNVEKSAYVLPKDDQEKDRLHEQHFLLKEKLGGNLMKQDLTLPFFEDRINVLDVGCGPATWLLELATEYPASNFYGIDIADTFPEAIYPANMHLKIGNVLDPIPFSTKFDFAQIRLLAVAMRESEWAPAFKNVHDAMNTGGLFQVIEICPLINTVDPEMQVIRGHIENLMHKKKQNPYMASILDTVLEQEHFEVIYKQRTDIPLGHGSKADILCGDTHREVLLGMAPFMAPEMNVDIPTYKAMVMKAAANMGPTKTTITVWAYMARRRD